MHVNHMDIKAYWAMYIYLNDLSQYDIDKST